MDKKPEILGILILKRNGKSWLSTVYESLRRDGYPNLSVYLVDNGSEDNSVELTYDRYPEVTIIRIPQNVGYCMAYNLAMPYALADGCEWVIWANNDIKIEPGCLSELARIAQSDLKIGVLGPGFLAWNSDAPNYYIAGNHPYAITAMKVQSREPIDVEWVEGSFLMVSRRCVESVGPLDPYLYFYWEEADFCRRARYQGWRVVLAPNALARHFAGGWSSVSHANRKAANHLQSRNYYIYKLANPFQGFLRNCVDALHLLLVNIKEAMWAEPERAWSHLSVFGGLLRDFRAVYAKWNRDRAGKHPNHLSEDLVSPTLDILPRENPGLMSAVDRLFKSNPADKEIL
jgi:GT2 family glycosyltransferase